MIIFCSYYFCLTAEEVFPLSTTELHTVLNLVLIFHGQRMRWQ